jgi:NAD(P)-dependent dehydrogenase (short-subunit alcohol dehydrogenase family)
MQFLVTGSSSGLGLALVHAILEAGHDCIATSRSSPKNAKIRANIEERGGKWVDLDVSDPKLETIISQIIADHGVVDCVINNAGYAIAGPLESEDLDSARAMMDTNFWGPVRIIKAIAPHMRARKAGTIVNITSDQVWETFPLIGLYAASKAALEHLTEGLTQELGVFNVRVLAVEAAAIRTGFASHDKTNLPDLDSRLEVYKGTMIEMFGQGFKGMHGSQEGDPTRFAKSILEEIVSPSANPPITRMPLGKEAIRRLKARADQYAEVATSREKVAVAADFDA